MPTSRLSRALVLIAGLALVYAAGCDESGDDLVIPAPAEPPRDTPRHLVSSYFCTSYSEKDSSAYADMLDDSFRFYFLEADRDSADLPPGALSWERGPELRSAGAMFRSAQVQSIVLELTPITDPVPTTGQPGQPAEEIWYETTCDLDLRVTVADPEGIDDTIFTVTNLQLLIVRPDLRAGHEGDWRLVIHRELDPIGRRAAGGTGVEPSSWGSIKAQFEN